VVDRDYPNKFYEKLLMPDESYYQIDNQSRGEGEVARKLGKQQYVLMEGSYLKAWRVFK
jgi:hypothetical protein